MKNIVSAFLVTVLLVGTIASLLNSQPIKACENIGAELGRALSGAIEVVILDVNASAYRACAGDVVHVYVTVEVTWNVFDLSSYWVEAFFDSNSIQRKIIFVLLSGHETLTIDFAWDTSGAEIGSHLVSATTSTMSSLADGYVLILPVEASVVVPDDYSTIQEAINHANDGDTVFVRNGVYIESIVINKTLTVRGESKYSTVVNNTSSMTDAIFVTAGGVNISDLRVVSTPWGGITLDGGGATVTDCIVTAIACTVVRSDQNTIIGNLMANCSGAISLLECDNNTVTGNTIANCHGGSRSSTTIAVNHADYNLLYHNNFIDCRWYWANDAGVGNMWYDNRSCEGNYWSNLLGNDTDGDGIVDMNGSAVYGRDYYPLVNPYWCPADVNHDLEVGIYDVVKITGAYGCTPSDPHWNPHADIAEPYGKIDILDIVTCTMCYGQQFTGFLAIQIYATDPNDYYPRTWDLVFDRPMPPLGDGGVHWGADVIETHYSGDIMIVQWSLAPGDHYLIFGITQTGGPEYGVYNGTITINGNSYSFDGLYGDLTVTIEFSI